MGMGCGVVCGEDAIVLGVRGLVGKEGRKSDDTVSFVLSGSEI